MATHTFGTNANNSLTAVKYSPSLSDADVATIQQAILDDFLQTNPISGAAPAVSRVYPGAFVKQGMLYIPNRGYLKMMPNDVIAVDPTTGWPILVAQNAVNAGGSVFTFT